MFKTKWLLLLIFSVLSLSVVSSSYEANQVGVSKERLDKIAPVLEEKARVMDVYFPRFYEVVSI